MSARDIVMAAAGSSVIIPPGQIEYTTPGTYSWVVPAGVSSICAVCVGGGSGGGTGYLTPNYPGSGGALAYNNNIAVSPGETLTVVVGAGGAGASTAGTNGSPGGISRIHRAGTSLVAANGGQVNAGGTVAVGSGGAGGAGGASTYSSGSGAGGYTGSGGAGVSAANATGGAGSGGGGGGGQGGYYAANSTFQTWQCGGGGGGVGILGQGANGAANGGGGSGGTNGGPPSGGTAGLYGGGGAYGTSSVRISTGVRSNSPGAAGGGGAVRIIWGTGRAFPSTNTGNL
jgi:hypothetical protein